MKYICCQISNKFEDFLDFECAIFLTEKQKKNYVLYKNTTNT